MNESVIRLVDAIKSGDAVETEQAFQDAIAEKLASKIEDMRMNIAQNMFAAQEEVVAEEMTITEEEWEALSEEEKSQYEVVEEGLVSATGRVIKKVVTGTANLAGNVVGGVAKTAGAIRQAPAAIGTAYNMGRAAAQKSIAK